MSTQTPLGTAELQGLWSANATDWAELHEQYVEPAFAVGLDALGVSDGTRFS